MRQPGEPLFDYPCSYSFRNYESIVDDNIELPDIYPRETPRREPVLPELEWTGRQWDKVQQLQAEIKFLEKKIIDKPSSKKRVYKTYE